MRSRKEDSSDMRMLLGAQAAERRLDARLAPVCISFANSGLRTPSPETPFHLLPWYYPIPLVTRHRSPRIFGGAAAVPPQTKKADKPDHLGGVSACRLTCQ